MPGIKECYAKATCPVCGITFMIGYSITEGCDECFKLMIELRKNATKAGWDSTGSPLTKESRAKCFALGIELW